MPCTNLPVICESDDCNVIMWLYNMHFSQDRTDEFIEDISEEEVILVKKVNGRTKQLSCFSSFFTSFFCCPYYNSYDNR